MILLENYLNNLNIKHLFFTSLTEKYKNSKNDTSIVNNFEKIKLLYDFTFNNNKNIINENTMEEYCNNNLVPLGPLKHPLEEGHNLWANYLFERLNKND